MDLQLALDFAARNHRAVLATHRMDGRPQLSPISSGVLDGALVISSRESLAKVRNLRRNPEASLLVQNDGFFGSWVQIDGLAEIVDQEAEGTLDLLVEVYRTIAGEHPDWDDYRAAMVRDNRVVIRIAPLRASGEL
jgi:PPOX class probable F420-dependent enzyme